jgi:hypothetical protein
MSPESSKCYGVERAVKFAGLLLVYTGLAGVLSGGAEAVVNQFTMPNSYDFTSHSTRDPAYLSAAAEHADELEDHTDKFYSGLGLVSGGLYVLHLYALRRPEDESF